jgi:hypothetical protein
VDYANCFVRSTKLQPVEVQLEGTVQQSQGAAMKGLLCFFWGFVLWALLNAGWVLIGFEWADKMRFQAGHVDDWMMSRGQYGQRQ